MHTVEIPLALRVRLLAPGVGLALVVSAASLASSGLVARSVGVVVSPLVVAMVLGALLGSLGARSPLQPQALQPGLDLTARTILRTGVVLLGLELSLGQLSALGWRGLTVIAITVACTFSGTLFLGRLMGVPAVTRLYVATGFSICGAAAIAAMRGVVAERRPDGLSEESGEDGDQQALGTALALVTVYGSIAIAVLPAVASVLGLTDAQAGLWIGASVQEVAQVVAAAGVVSGAALAAATVAKLARVVLLAPVLAMASVVWTGTVHEDLGTRRPTIVPGFVLGFLGAVVLRSTGMLPEGLLDATGVVRDLLLGAAMFALGTNVDVVRLVRTGRRALGLGAAASTLCAGVGLVATLALT
ncbi:YeiH family protein [Sanguibacter antarcticus]|nr:putative sulfate exporter family transporter [Sanguibacter antarcticus]